MSFFGDLRQAAYNKFKGIWDDRARPPYSDGYMFGVGATIDALKEMIPEDLTETLLERKCKKCLFKSKHCEEGVDYCRSRIEEEIVLVLSTIHRGLELPDEIGRSETLARMTKPRQGNLRQDEYWLRVNEECYEARSIIALAKRRSDSFH